MAESSYSFQDIFKLMNAMASFETLLDATDLDPASCVKLGIHEQFKALHEKLSKYVHVTEMEDLNIKCVCNLCCDEIKIFNFDLKSSLTIHNRSELHKIVAKNKEMNQQSRDCKSDFEQKLSQESNGGELHNIVAINKEINEESQDLESDLEKKTSQEVNDCELHNVMANNKQVNQGGQDFKTDFDKKLSQESINLNSIRSELKKVSLSYNSLVQNKGFIKPNVLTDNIQACRQQICTCQRAFCICDFKAKNTANAEEKLSNLDVSQNMVTQQVPPPLLAAPFPGGFQPLGMDQRHMPHGQSMQGFQPLGMDQRHMPRGQCPQGKPNKRYQEKKHTKPPPVANPLTEQAINIHVHMPPVNNQATAAQSITPQQQHQSRKQAADINLEKLRTKELGYQEEIQLMFRMVREAEGKLWRRENVTKIGNEFCCNVCNTGRNITNPYDLVKHIRGRSHQDVLRSTSSARESPPQTRYKNRNLQSRSRSADVQYVYVQQNVPTKEEENLEKLRSRELDSRAEMSLMWRMVKESEGDRWDRGHVLRDGDRFDCRICDIELNSPYQVVQHVQGQSHSQKLEDAPKECVVM